MSGFNWTRTGKKSSMRRYGVEVTYDVEEIRQFKPPRRPKNKKKKRIDPARKPPPSVTPPIPVRRPADSRPLNDKRAPVANVTPAGPIIRRAAARPRPRSESRPLPNTPPRGFSKCPSCSIWVEDLLRHQQKVHAPKIGRRPGKALKQKRRQLCPTCGRRFNNAAAHVQAVHPGVRCPRCRKFVRDLAEHRKSTCVDRTLATPRPETPNKNALRAAGLLQEQVRKDFENVPLPGKDAGRREELPVGTFEQRTMKHDFSRSSAHCWKCGARLYTSGACSNAECATRIVDP
jgi:hypothetical protein